MQTQEALAIVRQLAQGIDPQDQRVFEVNSPYNSPLVIRALHCAWACLERTSVIEKRARTLPANAGKPWSEEEDQKLLAAFDAGHKMDSLAQSHERTRGSIAARLVTLGRIADRMVVSTA